MSLPAIVAQAQAAAVGADAAPGGAGMAAAVLLPAKGEQRAGDRPPVDVDRVPHRPDVAAVAQPPTTSTTLKPIGVVPISPLQVSFFQPTATLAPLSV